MALKSSKAIQVIINSTKTPQWICRKYKVTAMTVIDWRTRGLPCIVIKGDRRPAIRFVKSEADKWIKDYLRKKKGKK